MGGFKVMILLALSMHAYAKLGENQTSTVQDAVTDQDANAQDDMDQVTMEQLVNKLSDDKFVETLANKLMDRLDEQLGPVDEQKNGEEDHDLHDALDDTILAKAATKASAPKTVAKRAPPQQEEGGFSLGQIFENLGGGVTPKGGRPGPTRGQSAYLKENAPSKGIKWFNKAIPDTQGGIPMVRPMQNSFVKSPQTAIRPRIPFTLAQEDTQTTSDNFTLLAVLLMGFFVGAGGTFVAFRSSQRTVNLQG